MQKCRLVYACAAGYQKHRHRHRLLPGARPCGRLPFSANRPGEADDDWLLRGAKKIDARDASNQLFARKMKRVASTHLCFLADANSP